MDSNNKELVLQLEKLFALAKLVSERCALDPALENVQGTAVQLFEECAENIHKICNNNLEEGPLSTGFGENEEPSSDVSKHAAPVLTPTRMEFRPALGEFGVPVAKEEMAFRRDNSLFRSSDLEEAAVLSESVTTKPRERVSPDTEPEDIPCASGSETAEPQAIGFCPSGHILELQELFGDGSCLANAEETENIEVSTSE
ncbi:hypothetical protein TTRE_0000879601 [Trichuris trichiura]|uniref:Uncharacterized protein n=1 Tax=Trichuris trichiura TaxID=36087 RepID=A0A077ZJ38_TRITR|nr:hypothetical protein TTRE_0000879601 [Trichuris trichiura]